MEGYPPLVDHYDGRSYWTTLRLPGGRMAGLKVEPDPPARGAPNQGLRVALYSGDELGEGDVQAARASVTHCWGLDEDMGEFYRVAGRPPVIGRLVERHRGMRSLSSQDPFQMVCISILLQNAPLARTNSMIACIVQRYGEPVLFEGLTLRHWPSPENLAKADPAELRGDCRLGFRAERLSAISRAVSDKNPDLEALRDMPTGEAKEALVGLKGIGEYSAEMVLLGLRRWDVFPVDVWSTRQFYRVLFPGREIPSKRRAFDEVRSRAEELWGRWRGLVLAFALHELDDLAERSESDAGLPAENCSP